MATSDRTNDRQIDLGTGIGSTGGEPIRNAFEKVNQNFDDLYSIASDISNVNRSIIPDTNEAYNIGSPLRRFKDIFLSSSTIHLGNTIISVNSNGELEFDGTKIPTQTDLNAAISNVQSGALTGSLTGDVTGSVFADDSTLLVDSIAGKIVGSIDTAQQAIFQDSIVLQNGSDIVTLGDGYGASFQLPNKSFSILGGGVGGGSYNIAFTSNGSGSILAAKQFNILGGEAIHIGTATGLTINNTVTVDAAVTAPSFVGDVTGSVFADDSSIMVDAVSNKLNASEIDIIGSGNAFQVYDGGFNWVTTGNMNLVVGGISGIVSTGDLTIHSSSGTVFVTNAQVTGDLIGNVIGNVTGNVTGTVTGDVTGSVFADDSTVLVDSVAGKIVGPVEASTITSSSYVDASSVNANTYGVKTSGSFINFGTNASSINVVANVDFTNADVTGAGFTYNQPALPGVSTEFGFDADIIDFGDGKTIDMQNSTVLFGGSTVRMPGFTSVDAQSEITLADEGGAGIRIENQATTSDPITIAGSGDITIASYNGEVILETDMNGTHSVFINTGKLTLQQDQIRVITYPPGSSKGSAGDQSGMFAFSSGYIYYCTTSYTDGVADIWKRVAWSGDTW